MKNSVVGGNQRYFVQMRFTYARILIGMGWGIGRCVWWGMGSCEGALGYEDLGAYGTVGTLDGAWRYFNSTTTSILFTATYVIQQAEFFNSFIFL